MRCTAAQAVRQDGWTAVWITITGAGLGLTLPPSLDAALGALPPDGSGVGNALLQAMRQMGGAIGVAVVFVGRMLLVAARTVQPETIAAATAPSTRLPARVGPYARFLVLGGVVFAFVMPFLPFANRYVVDIATTVLIYVMLGWVAVAAFPDLLDELGVTGTALVCLGGLLYTLGALVYAFKRPDPVPTVFGYHEIFHALVIVAAALQYAVVAFYVIPEAS